MAGRPVLLADEKRRAKVVEGFRMGLPQNAIARRATVGYSTLRNYMLDCQSEDASPEQVDFLAAVEEAQEKGIDLRFGQLDSIITEGGTAGVRGLEMWLRMNRLLDGPGGPSVAVDLDEQGRPTRITAKSGGEVEDLTDDEITSELTRAGR